jgi:hypothetical protein
MRESNTSNNSLLSVYFKRLETHKECTTRAWMQREKKIIIICNIFFKARELLRILGFAKLRGAFVTWRIVECDSR